MPELTGPTSPVSIHDEHRPRESSSSSGSTARSPENSVNSKQTGRSSGSGSSSSGKTAAHDATQRRNRHRQLKAVGPYILGKTLGKGQTGLVKMATHCKTRKQVAIKIIDRSHVKESVVRKVEREIVVMKLIQHPHLLRLFDVYDNTKYLFLVLEYVEGGELFDYLVKAGRLSPREARRLFRQIVSAISYCHDHCVCHRDLKPENLLLDSNNDIRVADFGMANLQLEVMRTSCGSPHYAAPEVIMGEHYDGFKADVWSCGVILYALLAGQLPFDDPNLSTLLEKVKFGHFDMPAYFPPKAQRLIFRMLERDPKRRISLKTALEDDWVRGVEADGSDLSQRPICESIEAVKTYPLLSTEHIDRDIFKNMLSFTCFKDKAELVAALLSEERNMEKAVYFLLLRRKGENPSVSDDSDIEDFNVEHNGYKFEARKRTDSFSSPLEVRTSSTSLGSASTSTELAPAKVPEVAAAKISDQMRQRTHSDCSPLLKAKTTLSLRVTPLPVPRPRRDSSPCAAASFSSLPGSPRQSPRSSPRGQRRPSGSIPAPLTLSSDRSHRISLGSIASPPSTTPSGQGSSVAFSSPLVSPPMSPPSPSPGLLRRLSQAFIGGTPQYHRRNMENQEVNALERNSLEMPGTPTTVKRSWFSNHIEAEDICFLADRRDVLTLKADICGVLKLLEVDVDDSGWTTMSLRCELTYERKYKITGNKKMLFMIEISTVDDARMKLIASFSVTCHKLSGSTRRFQAVCERLQGYMLARPQTASPDAGSDDDVLHGGGSRTSATPPAADNDSAYQSTASPDQSSEMVAETAESVTAGDATPPTDSPNSGSVPRRKLSKRKNFTRTYPQSENQSNGNQTGSEGVPPADCSYPEQMEV